MTNFVSVVRCKTKAGSEDLFVEKAKGFPMLEGVLNHTILKTGDRSFCSFTVWERQDSLVNARPQMIAFLDTVRDHLEELSPELGVTDPVSGPVLYSADKS